MPKTPNHSAMNSIDNIRAFSIKTICCCRYMFASMPKWRLHLFSNK